VFRTLLTMNLCVQDIFRYCCILIYKFPYNLTWKYYWRIYNIGTSCQQKYQLTLCEFLRCKKLRCKWTDCLQWFILIYFEKTEVIVQFHSEIHDKLFNSSIICFSPSEPPELKLKSLYYFSLHYVFMCSYDSPIQWRIFSQTLTVSTGWSFWWKQSEFCVRSQLHTNTNTNTNTRTHHTSTYIYICVYYRRVSVFKRLRDERRNCSKSRSLSCKIIRCGILTNRCFCSELYIVRTTEPAFPSARHITERGRERERVKEREAVLNNSSNQAVARVAVHRPRTRRSDEKHSDKYSLVWLYQKKMVFPRFRE